MKPRLALVTPALADANNGNWQTAARWARMLASDYRVSLLPGWSGGDEDVMVALHARRSAPAIRAWSARQPRRPLVVVLTGTDLYRDILLDASAQASLEQADRLIVLNGQAAASLPPAARAKAVVSYQSCRALKPWPHKAAHRLRALMVGHLREEKDPACFMAAARLLADRPDIHFEHIGAALDPALGEEARRTAAELPRYRWLGGLPHAQVRQRMRRAHLLVHASRMEGGAHVVMEAVRGGTPVLPSRIPGNLGLLGSDYPACFEVGDAAALAALLRQARDDPAMLPRLRAAGDRQAALFDPARERAGLLHLLQDVMKAPDEPHRSPA